MIRSLFSTTNYTISPLRAMVYAVAADLDDWTRPKIRKMTQRQVDAALRQEGIIPDCDRRKMIKNPNPREVIEPHTICAPDWQPYAAAQKENGGLRGSKATKWR